MDLLSSITGLLGRLLHDHAETSTQLSGATTYLVTAGPSKGGTILVDTGHDNCVLLDVLNNRDERTFYRVYTPEEAPALVDSALRALFAPSGGRMSQEPSQDASGPDLLSAFRDHLEVHLDPDTVRFELDFLDDTWLHVTSGPDRGAKALVRAVDGGERLIVHVLAPSGKRAGTVFVDSPDPSALRAAGDDLVALLLPLGGSTTRRERAASGAGEILLRGPVGLVLAAQDALLSTGAWALVAEGQDGMNSYAELAPADGSQALTAGAALAGGPDSGVMAL